MKKIIIFLLALIPLAAAAQTTPYYIRGNDTVYFLKTGFPNSTVSGNTEVAIMNSTRNVLGFLKNIGAGRTQFAVPLIGDIAGLQAAIDGKVPTTRTLTINSVTFDLSANRIWSITADTSGGLLSHYQTALNARVKYTDTATMLSAYQTGLLARVRYADTSTMLSAYQTAVNARVRWADTAALFTDYKTALNARIRIADTASFFSAYQTGLNARVKYTDTATMLSVYQTALNARVRYTDTATMLSAYQTGLLARVRYADTSTMLSAYQTAVNARVRWADTAALFTDYKTALNARVRIADTASFFSDYQTGLNARVRWADTTTLLADYQTALNARVKYTDTATMLSVYQTALNARVRYTDTATMLAAYQTGLLARVRYADTSTMLSAYEAALNARVRWADTSALFTDYKGALNARIRIVDTASFFSAYQTALNNRADKTHAHAASDITSGTFGNARLDLSAINQGYVPFIDNAVDIGDPLAQIRSGYFGTSVRIGAGLIQYSSAIGRFYTAADTIATTSDARTIVTAYAQPIGSYGTKIIASNVTLGPVTGTTAETVVFTGTIPAGTMGVNGSLHVILVGTWTSSSNAKTFRIRIGATGTSGTEVARWAVPNTTVSNGIYFTLHNRNSLTSQATRGNVFSTTTFSFTSNTGSSGGLGTYSLNTAIDLPFVVTITNANSGESSNLELLEVIGYK